MKITLLILQAILLALLVRYRRRVCLPWATAYFGLSLAAAIPYSPQAGWWWEWVRPITEPVLIVLRCVATWEALRPLVRSFAKWYARWLAVALVGLATGLAWLLWAVREMPRDWAAGVQDARSATYVGLSCAALFEHVMGEGQGFARAHAVIWTVLCCWHGVLEFGWLERWFMYPAWNWGETSAYVVAIACTVAWVWIVWANRGERKCLVMRAVA